MYLLRYLPPKYSNRLSISKAYIQEQVDNSRYLESYNVREKKTGAFFDKRWADNFGNLRQSYP